MSQTPGQIPVEGSTGFNLFVQMKELPGLEREAVGGQSVPGKETEAITWGQGSSHRGLQRLPFLSVKLIKAFCCDLIYGSGRQ